MANDHLPSVHTVHPGGDLQCATYLLKGPREAVLIDPGSGSLENEVLEGIRAQGASLGNISHALLTHCHVDHALGAYRFREQGIKLIASPRTAEIMAEGGHQVWYEYPDYVIPTEIDTTPADSETLTMGGIQVAVVYTPGHTDGCTSYLVHTDDGPTVFSGDLVNGRGNPGWAGSEGFSEAATSSSIERLLAHRPVRAFWGHGPVEGHATEWLRGALRLGQSRQWQLKNERHPQHAPPPSFQRRLT